MPYLTPPSIPAVYACRRLIIPDDTEFIGAVNGALLELVNVHNWEKFGAVTPEEAAEAAQQMIFKMWDIPCMIGATFPYLTDTPPYGCLPCDGTVYQRVDYPELYAALNPVFIIDADTFQTPDLRGRTVVASGAGAGLTARDVGDTGGEETHTLTELEMPAHSHTTQPHSHTDAGHTHFTPIPTFLAIEPGEAPTYTPLGVPVGGQTSVPGFASIVASDVTVDSAGNGDSHNNMPPFLSLPYCVVAR